MKNFNTKVALVAGVAALALVGTGYAAWHFSSDASVDVSGNVNIIAKDTEVGTLNLKAGQTFSIVLDQKEDGGVYWADASGNKLNPANVVLEYKGIDRVVKETISISMESDCSALETYVTFGADAEAQEFTWTGGTDAEEITFALPTVEYTDAYPLNETQYDAMVTALDGAEVTFTFSAEVVECTHA